MKRYHKVLSLCHLVIFCCLLLWLILLKKNCSTSINFTVHSHKSVYKKKPTTSKAWQLLVCVSFSFKILSWRKALVFPVLLVLVAWSCLWFLQPLIVVSQSLFVMSWHFSRWSSHQGSSFCFLDNTFLLALLHHVLTDGLMVLLPVLKLVQSHVEAFGGWTQGVMHLIPDINILSVSCCLHSLRSMCQGLLWYLGVLSEGIWTEVEPVQQSLLCCPH